MSRRRSDDLRKVVQHEVQRQLGALGLATKADLKALEGRVARSRGGTAHAPAKKSTPAKKKAPAKKSAAKKAPTRKSTAKAAAKKASAKSAPKAG